MENNEKGQFNEQIRERTIRMAVEVYEKALKAHVNRGFFFFGYPNGYPNGF